MKRWERGESRSSSHGVLKTGWTRGFHRHGAGTGRRRIRLRRGILSFALAFSLLSASGVVLGDTGSEGAETGDTALSGEVAEANEAGEAGSKEATSGAVETGGVAGGAETNEAMNGSTADADTDTDANTIAGNAAGADVSDGNAAGGDASYGDSANANAANEETDAEASSGAEESNVTEETTGVDADRRTLTLLAAGDNLVHTSMLAQARQADGHYDFHPVYQYVRDFIQSYDIAVINQETIFVDNPAYASSYPEFGTPESMGEALVDAGFDVILSATNHTMDKGTYGVDCTLNYWKSHHPEITLLGLNQTAAEYGAIDYVEKNGIRLAMFNYTYGLNGHGLPQDRPYLVNLLQNQSKFLQDVRLAEQTADLTVCFLHIGEEYTYTPTAYQQSYVRSLIDNGADIIICAHPHVVEPYGLVTTQAGNVGLVYYSCGNFICNQAAMDRALGGLASVEIVKDAQGCRVESYDFIPTVAHFNQEVNRVYLLRDYTDELAAQHIMGGSGFYVQAIWNLWNHILGKG